ncbi:MAG: serpin family protein [Actinomycetaceae bacterium]|nr:serpin family protein [Actinomycetaceae bacterium]
MGAKTRKYRRGVVGLVVGVGLLLAGAGCGTATQAEANEVRSEIPREQGQATGEQVAQFVQGAERLALESLKGKQENLVVSPASLQIAGGMVALGAKGETKEALDAMLGTDDAAVINLMEHSLKPWAGNPAVVKDKELPEKPVVHVANNVAIDDEAQVEKTYLDDIARNFGAGIMHTDLGSSEGFKPLNAWVQENSGGLIEKSALQPDKDMRLALQNAIVLAARWAIPFQEEDTRPADFHTANGNIIQVPTMEGIAPWFFLESQGWSMVDMPFSEGMTAQFILPPPDTMPGDISPEILGDLKEQADTLRASAEAIKLGVVKVSMPKVKMKTSMDLEELFEKMGAGIAFTELADFSGMSTTQKLLIGQAKQQVVLDIDEEGTKAAAVTEIAMKQASAPVIEYQHELILDRPYLVVIRTQDTGWPLFVSQVMDPSAQ